MQPKSQALNPEPEPLNRGTHRTTEDVRPGAMPEAFEAAGTLHNNIGALTITIFLGVPGNYYSIMGPKKPYSNY